MRRECTRRKAGWVLAAVALAGPGCAAPSPTRPYVETLREEPLHVEARLVEQRRLVKEQGLEPARRFYDRAGAHFPTPGERSLLAFLAARLEPDLRARAERLAAVDLAPLGQKAYGVLVEMGTRSSSSGAATTRSGATRARWPAASPSPPASGSGRCSSARGRRSRRSRRRSPATTRSRCASPTRSSRSRPSSSAAPARPSRSATRRTCPASPAPSSSACAGSRSSNAPPPATGPRRSTPSTSRCAPEALGRSRRTCSSRSRPSARGLLEEGDLAALEALGLLGGHLYGDEPLFPAALALAARASGDREAARAHAARAVEAEPGDGAAARLLRLARIEAPRPDPRGAFQAFRRSIPASLVFGPRNGLWDRYEQLRVASAVASDRPAPASMGRLARAMASVGWTREARALLPATDPATRADLDAPLALARTVEVAVQELPEGASLEAAAERILEATRGSARWFDPLPIVAGELGSLVTPAHPLLAELEGLGLLLVGHEGPNGAVIRLLTVLAEVEVPIRGEDPARGVLVEGRSLLPGPRSGLQGRTSVTGRAFFIDADELRPARADVLALLAASRPAALGAEPPAEPRDPLRPLWRLLAARVLAPGASVELAREELLQARVDYVAAHEAGHVRDLRRLRPPTRHPLLTLARLWEGGLRAAGIAARYEEEADLFALSTLASSAAARLSLARAALHAPGDPFAAAHREGARAVIRSLLPDGTPPERWAELLAALGDDEVRVRALERLEVVRQTAAE